MESVWELKEGYSRLVINKPSEKQHEEIKVPHNDKNLKTSIPSYFTFIV